MLRGENHELVRKQSEKENCLQKLKDISIIFGLMKDNAQHYLVRCEGILYIERKQFFF